MKVPTKNWYKLRLEQASKLIVALKDHVSNPEDSALVLSAEQFLCDVSNIKEQKSGPSN